MIRLVFPHSKQAFEHCRRRTHLVLALRVVFVVFGVASQLRRDSSHMVRSVASNVSMGFHHLPFRQMNICQPIPTGDRTQADLLTEDEKVVMGSAICMFCGLKYREKNSDTADDEWYEKCIGDELDEITLLYEKPQYKNDMHKLRTHPTITYVGDKWLRATDEGRELAIANLELADIFPLCDEGAIKHPSWNTQLHMKNLDVLVGLQKDEHKWWLLAKLSGNVAASHVTPSAIAGLNTAPVSASVHDAPTVNEDIEMEDDGGETPRKKKVGKCLAVQSPTPVRRVSNRRHKADSGDAITLSSPESESGGLMSARPPPAVCPPTPHAPAEPAAERRTSRGEYISSGDDVKVPTACKKRKRRESAIIDNSASELETGLTDPGACGPCKLSHHKCKPQVSTKGLVCRLCIKWKAKCDPPSAVSQAIINARKKKHSIEDVIKRLDITSRTQEFNTTVRDFMYNTDTVLCTVCTHGPGKVNLAFLGLRLPAVPLFADVEASTPGGSSVASGAASSVSSLGVSRMMLDNVGVAGPSKLLPKYEETESSNAGLRRRAPRSGTSSRAQSRAGSRQSSRGHK
ncbi:hypothetical protein EDB83DRAFT_2530359 [Lactarius deliciosus]|nr:hypothetical protein EDB83DRAFT_2530359 [Lactarius deliciosus]